MVHGHEEQGDVSAVLGDASGADDGDERLSCDAVGAKGVDGLEKGGDALLADVGIVHAEVAHVDGSADGEVDCVDHGGWVRGLEEDLGYGNGVVGIALLEDQVGWLLGEVGFHLGWGAAEGDACVARGDGALES